VFSSTVVRRGFHEDLQALLPIHIAIVEIDAAPGVRIVTNSDEPLAIDTHVRLEPKLADPTVALVVAVPDDVAA
jgi:hypothetical protein